MNTILNKKIKYKNINNKYAMKISNSGIINMITYIIVSLASLTLVSCRKDDVKINNEITTEDAVDAIVYTIENESGGYSSHAKYATEDLSYSIYTLQCGQSFDTTFVKSYVGPITANYTFSRNYILNCDSLNNLTSINCTGSYTGNYEGPRLKSYNSGFNSWYVTGLNNQVSNFYINGSFTRLGIHESKIRNKKTFDTQMNISTTNLEIEKSTGHIIGGNAMVELICTNNEGVPYTFNGSITFSSSGIATLSLNGNTYTIYIF